MKQSRYRVMVGVFIVMLLCVCALGKGASSVYSEGLSDAQLYGNGEENVLGNKASKSPKQSTTKQSAQQNSSAASDTSVSDAPKKETVTADGTKRADMEDAESVQESEASGSETASDTKVESKGESQSNAASQDADVVQSDAVSNDGSEALLPTINVDGIEDGGYYNDTVQMDIEVRNVDEMQQEVTTCLSYSDASGNAKQKIIGVHREGTIVWGAEELEDEGAYELSVEVGAVIDSDSTVTQLQRTDSEQTFAHKQIAFEIDKTPPSIDLSKYTSTALQEIDVKQVRTQSVSDRTPVDSKVSINGQEVSDIVISDEGAYEVTIDAVDAAGNQSSQSGVMTIRTASDEAQTSSRAMGCGVGVVLLAGSTLLYRERKKLKKEEDVNENK